MMTAMHFVDQYTSMLEEIDGILHPDLYPVICNLYREDPHDMIEPHQYFPSRQSAMGFLIETIIRRSKALRASVGNPQSS